MTGLRSTTRMSHPVRLLALALALAVAGSHALLPAPAAAASARTPKLSELFGDEVVARGKGVEIKRSQVDESYIAYRANLASRGERIPEERRALQEAQLLQRLVVTQVLTNRVTPQDRQEAAKLAAKFIAESKGQAPSEEAFYRQLKAMGMGAEQFQRRVDEQSLAEAVVQRELGATIQISDDQVKDFYANGTDVLVRQLEAELARAVKNPAVPPDRIAQGKQQIDTLRKGNLARLEQPEKVRVSHIFLATQDRKTEEQLPEDERKFKRQRIEKLRQRALQGEDFSKLVLEFSEDRSLKETRGEYTFTREEPFAPEFKAAAFSLQPGKISDVVTSILGFHVIKLIEKIAARKVEVEKVAKDLKNFLTQQEVQRAMPDYFARLSEEAGVEILDDKLKLPPPRERGQAPSK